MRTNAVPARRGLIRQGDVLLIPCAPDDWGVRNYPPHERTDVSRVDGRLILATGEATGHAHAIVESHARIEHQVWRQTQQFGRPGTRRNVLVVEGNSATLVHEEHDPLVVPPGAWLIRRQREYAPSRSGRASSEVSD